MPPSWIAPTVFSGLATLLVGLVLAYLRGIAKDLTEMRQRAEEMQREWQLKLDTNLKDVKAQVGSQQDKLEGAIKDIRAQVDVQQREQRLQADKQQEQMTAMRIEMSKMQEQLYSILRGASSKERPSGGTP